MSTLDKIILNGTEYDLGGSGGISSVAQALLINILRNGIYENDQSLNITNLETELAQGGGGSRVAIVNNLTNCTNSNSAISVDIGASYVGTITANEGYEIESASVLMGGVDVTSSVYSVGVITIPNVTGTLVITVTAITQEESGLIHRWDLTSGSLVDAIDGETELTLEGSAAISSNTGILISGASGHILVPFTSPTSIRAKIVFGDIDHSGSGNQGLIGGRNYATSTPSKALRYSQSEDLWETGSDVTTGITGATAFEGKELTIIRDSSSAVKMNIVFDEETIVDGYSGGAAYNYLDIGGGFYNVEIKSIKVFES